MIMNGAAITLVRVKPLGWGVSQTFTIRGTITDGTFDDNGRATSVRIHGRREEDDTPVDAWYAVGPRALDGSQCTQQKATLDVCGHDVTDGCDCDTIAAEADAQTPDVHVVSATLIETVNGQGVLSMCGQNLGAYRDASATHPVGNYLTPTSPHLHRVTCTVCRNEILRKG